MRLLKVLLLLLVCACQSEPVSGIRLTVIFPADAAIDQLSVAVDVKEKRAATPTAQSPTQVLLLLPPAAGETVKLTVEGLSNELVQWRGSQAVLRDADLVEVTIELKAVCEGDCPANQAQCFPTGRSVCTRDSRGCYGWTVPVPCPTATPACSNGKCAVDCVDDCEIGKRSCADATHFYDCGNLDADSCNDRSAPQACPPGQRCRDSDGACVPDCNGKPCQCKPQETQSCSDVGSCTGGIRNCENGSFGPCKWAQGPSAEVCDGKDNDCDNSIDEATDLTPPLCAEQRGVCNGARAHCAGLAGWASCDAADYSAIAKARGETYEANESSCDQQDNDCDGIVDEGCLCLGDCTTALCGGDDGCGKKCATGSCTQRYATCSAGSCGCAVPCGSACCAPGEQCSGGRCAGGKVWALQIGDALSAGVNAIAVDRTGAIYALGGFSTSVTLGTTTLKATGSHNLFLVKVMPDGVVSWTRQLSTTGLIVLASELVVDDNGNPTIALRSPAVFTLEGSTKQTSATPDSNALATTSIWAFASDGTFRWQRTVLVHPLGTKGGQETCDNGSDDDGDKATDCLDPDCLQHSSCVASTKPASENFRLVTDAAGNVWAVGNIRGLATVSDAPTLTFTTDPAGAVLALRLAAKDGAPQLSSQTGAAATVHALVHDGAGTYYLLVGRRTAGTITLGALSQNVAGDKGLIALFDDSFKFTKLLSSSPYGGLAIGGTNGRTLLFGGVGIELEGVSALKLTSYANFSVLGWYGSVSQKSPIAGLTESSGTGAATAMALSGGSDPSFASGRYTGPIIIGTKQYPRIADWAWNSFVVRLDASGKVASTTVLQYATVAGLARLGQHAVVGGRFSEATLRIAGQTLTRVGNSSNGFIARIAP
ncbi:MAG: hypothetical protein H6707_21080 [Deltaproteobacteria bacterium]|nr:hypothetical protein [Deltaproteobacteria bacterium]